MAQSQTFDAISTVQEGFSRTNGLKATFLGALILSFIVTFGAQFLSAIPASLLGEGSFVGTAISLFLSLICVAIGALVYSGVQKMALDAVRGEKVSPLDCLYFLKGHGPVKEIILGQSVVYIVTYVGFLLLIVPGIILSMLYMLTLPLIFDKGLSFWDAMETSRKYLWSNFLEILILSVVTFLIIIAATIPLGIGWLWAFPALSISLMLIYDRAFGESSQREDRPSPEDIAQQPVKENSAVDKLLF